VEAGPLRLEPWKVKKKESGCVEISRIGDIASELGVQIPSPAQQQLAYVSALNFNVLCSLSISR
jgi:hypothetical protein